MDPCIKCSIIYNTQDRGDLMNEYGNVVHVAIGILFSHKKEGNPAICDNTNGHLGHEIRQPEKDKYCMISYMESEKKELINTDNR